MRAPDLFAGARLHGRITRTVTSTGTYTGRRGRLHFTITLEEADTLGHRIAFKASVYHKSFSGRADNVTDALEALASLWAAHGHPARKGRQ